MFQVNKERCTGCEICVDICPTGAISMIDGKAWIDTNQCNDCGQCVQNCPQGAIYSEAQFQQNFFPNRVPMFPGFNSGIGKGMGRGLGRGKGRGLGRGPRDGRGGGMGGGGRRR
jgi:Fe-S-cluster-containing hydrogenase component 2